MFNEFSTALNVSHPTPNIHRLRLRLLGYLILFTPLAFVSQCQFLPRLLPSPFGPPYKITVFYHYFINLIILYKTLDIQFLILSYGSHSILNKT